MEFINSESSKRRLLSYYKKAFGTTEFPIQVFLSRNVDLMTIEDLISDDEFLINGYLLKHNIALIITSRKLRFIKNKAVFDMAYEKIRAIFLLFPYKNDKSNLNLSIVVDEDSLLTIEVGDLELLTRIRNEIYRVIRNVLVNWEGTHIQVKDLDISKMKPIDFPPTGTSV